MLSISGMTNLLFLFNLVKSCDLYVIFIFSDYPHIIFLNLAHAALWPLCEDFCNTFGISLPQCIEYAGDVFLKKRKVPQAITAFNVARVSFLLFLKLNCLFYFLKTGNHESS